LEPYDARVLRRMVRSQECTSCQARMLTSGRIPSPPVERWGAGRRARNRHGGTDQGGPVGVERSCNDEDRSLVPQIAAQVVARARFSALCHRRASRDLPRDDQLPSVEEMKVVGACGRILPARAHPGAYASRLPSHWFGRLTRGKRTDASAQRGRYRAVGAFAQEHTKRAPIRLKRSLR
jgi:hypothetical protein